MAIPFGGRHTPSFPETLKQPDASLDQSPAHARRVVRGGEAQGDKRVGQSAACTGLERSASPQQVLDRLPPKGVTISSVFIRPMLGGDLALPKGVARRLLELDDEAAAACAARVLDPAFITEHTAYFDAFSADLCHEGWDDLIAESGVSRADIERLPRIHVRGKAAPSRPGA